MNIEDWQLRTELMLGKDKHEKLKKSNVLVVGLGGVGAYAAELICRAGVGKMTVIDGDTVDPTNRNRQLLALKSTHGKSKAELMGERLKDINPDLELTAIHEYLRDDRMKEVLNENFDYVVDAIDTLSPKTYLLKICVERNLRIISSMGSGAKSDPSKVQVADIDKSYNCMLARAIRKRLHKMGIKKGIKVVFSTEEAAEGAVVGLEEGELTNKRSLVGTISYMPAIFGIYCASVVIRDLISD